MGRSLKEGEIEELKSRADIYSVISGYVKLKKTGKNYTGLCPFHKEKTPSFTVDASKQLYHCFGCGEGGDVITFVEKIENMEFAEAVEFLAKRVGYNLKYNYSGSYESSRQKNRLVELNELAKKYYNFILFNSKKGQPSLSYLKSRGFKENTLREFEIGYSLDSWENFSKFALKRGYKAQELVQCGLAIESSKGGIGIYDRFRGRIMFPIEDIVGKVVAFGGRIISEKSKTGDRKAKYINTPETKLYSKSKNIYRIFQAKNHIVEKDEVLIVEGYTDVMALHQEGIRNVVASLGTALTSEQIKVLGRFTKNIVLVFDSDKAGINASLKGIERLREYNDRLDLFYENNLNIRVVVLEEGYDPADFVFKKGKEAFLKKVEEAPGIIDFTIDMIANKYDTGSLAGKLKASDHLLRFISTLSSGIVQEECIKKVAQKLNLKESLLFEEMLKKKYKNETARRYGNRGYGSEEKEAVNETIIPLKKVEIEALGLIINGLSTRIDELLDLGPAYFKFDDTRELYLVIRDEIIKTINAGEKVNFPVKITSGKIVNEEARKLYNNILFSETQFADRDNDLAACEIINNLKGIRISEEIEDIRKKMIEYEKSRSMDKDTADGDDKLTCEYDRLYQRLIELEKERMNLRMI
ncbi:MAG: DNA primase [Candidatus Humimicrobiaceae bacterium]|jgi:DNA primase|nr:DNA primase [Candidatus Humimicrobiaceae bacterium]